MPRTRAAGLLICLRSKEDRESGEAMARLLNGPKQRRRRKAGGEQGLHILSMILILFEEMFIIFFETKSELRLRQSLTRQK